MKRVTPAKDGPPTLSQGNYRSFFSGIFASSRITSRSSQTSKKPLATSPCQPSSKLAHFLTVQYLYRAHSIGNRAVRLPARFQRDPVHIDQALAVVLVELNLMTDLFEFGPNFLERFRTHFENCICVGGAHASDAHATTDPSRYRGRVVRGRLLGLPVPDFEPRARIRVNRKCRADHDMRRREARR